MIEPLSDLWFDTRRRLVTSTDVGPIVYSVNPVPWSAASPPPFKVDLDVYEAKHGPDRPVRDSAPMEWGRRKEPAVREKFLDARALPCTLPGLLVRAGWAGATPDAIVHDAAGDYPLEVKCTEQWNAGDWSKPDEPVRVPLHYYYQAMWHAYVMGADRFALCVLIGASTYREYTWTIDGARLATMEGLVALCRGWWERHIDQAEPPPIKQWSLGLVRHVERRPEQSGGPPIEGPEIDRLGRELMAAQAEAKALDARVRELKAQIKDLFGPAEEGQGQDVTITRRSDKRGRVILRAKSNHKETV